MDINTIAKKVGLLPEEDCSWAEDNVPLCKRGVKLAWLYQFVEQVDKHLEDEWIQYEYQAKAATYFDYVPEPDRPQFPRYQILNPLFLVPNLIKPLTIKLKSPLYARVPVDQRGKPDVFISHTWSQALITNNPFSTLHIISEPMQMNKKFTDDSYIWMDLVAYNQHSIESIALDIKAVIQSIGQLCLPLIDAAPFSRLWCLWEILCAHVTKSDITVYEPFSYAQDIGYVARVFSENFRSVSNASTTLPRDKEQILNAMISTFGSIRQTDEYLHKLVKEGLTKESDKPWYRPKP